MIPISENQSNMKRIVGLLEASNISLAEFARRMGVTSAYVSNWRRRGIPPERLPRAADILGVSLDVIQGRVTDAPEGGIPVVLSGRVPVIGYAMLGDNGFFAEMHNVNDGFISLPSRDVMAYALKCEGTSMLPRIQPGEYVVAEPSVEAQPGDEVVVQDNDGRVMVKRFLYWRNGILTLGSINETQPNILLNKEDVKAIHPVLAIIPKKLWNP